MYSQTTAQNAANPGLNWAAHGIDTGGRTTGRHKVTCPNCIQTKIKHPHAKDLSIDLDAGYFRCHHCDFLGRAKRLNGSWNESWRHQTISTQPKVYNKPTWKKPSPETPPEALEWGAARGLTAEVLDRYQVEYGEAPGPDGSMVGWLMFPYFRGREVVNVKCRSLAKDFRFIPQCELVPYGLDDIEEGKPVIWVEGEADKLSFAVAGYSSCISVPNGAPSPTARNYEREFSYLEGADDYLKKARCHILAVDSDAPGKLLEQELIRRLGPENCYTVIFPEDCKDANEVLMKYGPDRLGQIVKDARPVPVEGISEVADAWQKVCFLYENGMPGGAFPGWENLYPFYQPKTGQWTVITGIPSHGKSQWLDNLTVQLAEGEGWQIGVFSPENYPLERHIANLISIYTGQSFGQTQYGPRMDLPTLAEAGQWLQDHFTFILPEENPTLDDLLAKARVLIYRRGIKGLVIDPWNEIDHQSTAGESETQYISKALTKIRRFARLHDIHIWLVAHPAKLQKNKDGDYPVPTPYDISGSAHWRNKADFAITIYRMFDESHDDLVGFLPPHTQVHVQKVRFRECGRVGMARLFFDDLSGRYYENPVGFTTGAQDRLIDVNEPGDEFDTPFEPQEKPLPKPDDEALPAWVTETDEPSLWESGDSAGGIWD
jgi:twinkle protein